MPSLELKSLKTLSKIFDDDFKYKIAFHDPGGNTQISYGRLRSWVHQCAEELIRFSDTKERKVLIFLDSGLVFVTVFYACLLAARTPILLNTKLKDELKSLDSLDSVILTDKKNSLSIEKYMNINKNRVLVIDLQENPDLVSEYEYPEFHPDDRMAYLFTSGSSGKAKLVPKTFANLMTEVRYLKGLLTATEEDIYLPLVPSFHIYGLLYTVLLPLYTGSGIRLDIPFSPLNILEDGMLNKTTMVIANPSHYSAMSSFLDHCKEKDFSRIRYCISSTMPVDQDIIIKMYEMLNIRLIEFYGSTETGGIAYRKFYKAKTWKFFPQIKWKLDTNELMVSSPMVSSDESRDETSEVWHSTGDLVNYHEETGGFSLLGRMNQIVKVAGNRVSCLEVAKVIREIPDVQDVVVMGVPSKTIAGEELLAYLVTENEAGMIKKVKQFCRSKLPDFKVPSRFMIVPNIEKGANGKVLFRKLPVPRD
ncbi:MAG TPA: long-chain fatty acid--CoA ligase [Spirochaetes bacterium]|nr:long-chain fatty acid--CoA ligase [Spirochaetota bacterium]